MSLPRAWPLPCCLLTLDSPRTRFTELYICTRIFFFNCHRKMLLCVYVLCVCVCVCMLRVVIIWGYFIQKETPWAAVWGQARAFILN